MTLAEAINEANKRINKLSTDDYNKYVEGTNNIYKDLDLFIQSNVTTDEDPRIFISTALYRGKHVKQLLRVDENYQVQFIKDLT